MQTSVSDLKALCDTLNIDRVFVFLITAVSTSDETYSVAAAAGHVMV